MDVAYVIRVGKSQELSIAYSTGAYGHEFGDPPRVGLIEAEARGLVFGAPGAHTSRAAFFRAVRQLIPEDSKVLAAYTGNVGWKQELFVMRSASLAKQPGIGESSGYFHGKASDFGTFMLFVSGLSDDNGSVGTFLLALGKPNDADTSGLHKVRIDSLPID